MPEKLLLDKVRQLSRLILKSNGVSFDIGEALNSLASVIDASVFVVDTDGHLLLWAFGSRRSCPGLEEFIATRKKLPSCIIESVNIASRETEVSLTCRKENAELFPEIEGSSTEETVFLTVLPILSVEDRIGAFTLMRCGCAFKHDDLILAEIGAVLLGIVMNREAIKREQDSTRNKLLAAVAFNSLSYAEVEAIEEVIKLLNGNENIIVASKIADYLGITRSIIVNALRKFESAGIIESRSLGVKGTSIRIKNPEALQEVSRRSYRFKSGS